MTKKERMRFVRAEMVRAGVSNADIAREEQVSTVYVYYVLAGKRQGYRIRLAIAKKVGKPVEALWPDTPVKDRRAA